ncbi:MAG: hypothetical protein AB1513_11965 [Pseudomonadota bacterium]
MGTRHEIFDGSDATLIEAARSAFEADAGPYGFDLTRHQCAAPEPWSEYADPKTGHRWAGWLAAFAAQERMAADAARYNFLRGRDLDTINKGGVFAGMTPRNVVLHGEDLDAEIDAAMLKMRLE